MSSLIRPSVSLARNTARSATIARAGAQGAMISSRSLSTATTSHNAALIAARQPVQTIFQSVSIRSLQQDAKRNTQDQSWVKKGSVDYSELKPITEAPTGEITIIDVREPSETSQGMIPSAVNVPLSDFTAAFSPSGNDFNRKYAFERPSFDDKIIVYCRSGKRSQQALEEAKKRGWWNVRNYTGSWLDWNSQQEARGNKDGE
ncbi:unnamed protein product [Sympodiomycopsis kandeliae]